MDNVQLFEQQRKVHRHIVKIGDKRLALPAVWTKERWEKLNKKDRGFIFLACTSFRFYLHRVYLPFKSEIQGEEYPLELPEFMGDFADSIQSRVPPELVPFDQQYDPKLPWRLCRVWPTGCFKSSLLEAFESWLMGVNPNVAIIKGVSIKQLGERFVAFHQSNIANNEVYRHVFGDLNPKATAGSRTWRADSIEIERPLPHSAPTYAIIGYQGSFEGTRFDIGLLDDIVDFQNSKTEDARVEQYNWVSEVFERRLHPRRRLLFGIGTIHHRDDYYSRCRRHSETDGTWDYEEIKMIPQKAVDAGMWPPKKVNEDLPYSMENVIVPEDLPTLWDFWSPAVLTAEYVANPHTFAKTRQHQVHDPDSGTFTEKDLDFCLADGGQDPEGNAKPKLPMWSYVDGIPQPGSPIHAAYKAAGIDIEYVVVTADFAATDKTPGKDPDWTVYELWGWCRRTQRRVLLDVLRFRSGNPKVMKSKLVQFVRGYLPLVRRVAGEANAVDKLFVEDLSTFLRGELGIGVIVVSLRGEKAELIESFKDLIYDKGVWLPYSVASPRTRRDIGFLREELLEYPSGAHDDMLIAAVHHLRLIKSGSFSGGVQALVLGGDDPDAWQERYDSVPDAEMGQEPDSPWGHIMAERERVLCNMKKQQDRAQRTAGYR